MKVFAAAVSLMCLLNSISQAETIWVEGETPAKSTMNRHPWWYDQVKQDQLSGGDWISNFADKKPAGEAAYSVTSKYGGKFEFWVRANPWQVRKLDGFVRLNRSDAAKLKVTALDQFGQPSPTKLSGDAIRLQAQTLYDLIESL